MLTDDVRRKLKKTMDSVAARNGEKLKVFACPIGGIFFDELYFIMICFDN